MPEKEYKYIVGIVNDKKHYEENKSIEDMLKGLGLKGSVDYILSPLPPSFEEIYPVPVLWVRKNNTPNPLYNEHKYEKFFGKESIELFLEEVQGEAILNKIKNA